MACTDERESKKPGQEQPADDWTRRVDEALERLEKHREEYFAARERLLRRAC